MEFQTDAEGNIITNPVTGWKAVTVMDSAVLVAFKYVESEEQLEAASASRFSFC